MAQKSDDERQAQADRVIKRADRQEPDRPNRERRTEERRTKVTRRGGGERRRKPDVND